MLRHTYYIPHFPVSIVYHDINVRFNEPTINSKVALPQYHLYLNLLTGWLIVNWFLISESKIPIQKLTV